jgi:hypothetical protein
MWYTADPLKSWIIYSTGNCAEMWTLYNKPLALPAWSRSQYLVGDLDKGTTPSHEIKDEKWKSTAEILKLRHNLKLEINIMAS